MYFVVNNKFLLSFTSIDMFLYELGTHMELANINEHKRITIYHIEIRRYKNIEHISKQS